MSQPQIPSQRPSPSKIPEEQLGTQQNAIKQNNKILKQKLMKENKSNVNNIQTQTCTKYNRCFDGSQAVAKGSGEQLGDQWSSFEIPSQVLKEEQPYWLDIKPQGYDHNKSYLVQLLVQNNLQQNAKKQRSLRQKIKSQQKLKKQRIQNLNQKSQKIIQQCSKRPLSSQKRAEWNHSIFGEEKKIRQNSQKRNSQNLSISRKQGIKNNANKQNNNKNQLLPINDRIINYKQKQKVKKKEQKNASHCNHKHLNPDKSINQKQQMIRENAKQTLKKIRDEKKKQEQKKKILKAKIRAIQIQSKNSLKRFKKKVIDPTIQFIVDVPITKDKAKKKIQSNKQLSLASSQISKINSNKKYRVLKDVVKTQKKSTASKNQIKLKTSENKENDKNRKQDKDQGTRKQLKQENENPEGKKFYLWNIPIYRQDLEKRINQDQQSLKIQKPTHKKPSFRDEVKQYLQNKLHNKMVQSNKKIRQAKFMQIVQEKKRVILDQYENQYISRKQYDMDSLF